MRGVGLSFLAATLAATLSLTAAAVHAADPATFDAPQVPEKVRQLMQDRNYAEAVKAIDEAVAAKDAPKDYLAYLKGRALFLQNEFDKAAAVFDRMQQEFPESPWLRRARFAKAGALARQGDFRAAEATIRAEADYLLSAERRQQTADVYLEFADALFKPSKEELKPDYAAALEFYQKALEAGPKPEKRIEIELLVARCQQELGKRREAISLYERFIKDYPRSSSDLEARFCLGETQLAEGDSKQARRTWQDLLAKHAETSSERIADATFQLARTWHIPKPGSDEELNLGVAALRAFIERFPKHKLASRAHLQIAESFVSRGRHDDAVAALRQFLSNDAYQLGEEIPEARSLLGRCYQLQKKFPEALETWREYLTKHPADKAWSDVQRAIIDTEYLAACEKVDDKQYDAANRGFAEFLVKYPLDPRNPNILLLMNRKALAEEKWDDAIAAWRRVVSKYPNTDAAWRAQYDIADTLEKKMGKLEEALEEYRKVAGGGLFDMARQAVARLTAASMTVATERVFRSNEKPKLKLITRNIETVTVRAYKVDMETYFRKMHLARGVEGLDIALIDPDATFEFKVPNYARHQQIESTIEAPLPGGAATGVMAVTVSSKTLEATTLVIQSDLDVIVKSSRDEVFVFAENMLTGKPWPGARLLVSSGRQVFAEGTTDKDGVLQQPYKELKELADVRVFAVAGDNVASNVVDLQGLGIAQGLTDKGYLYTDRPAYRAGQLVHVRGCLRRAVDDAYSVQQGKKFTLEVFDSRNRLLRQETVALGEFGSFHSQFVLPKSSPQGRYRVLARDDAGQNYQGDFTVHDYRLEPVRLTVDAPRRVYYRGEEIEGTIVAAYHYGMPLVGREIRYQLADDRQYAATTDDKGQVHFKLPTREFSESQLLALKVELPERSVQAGANFYLAAQGFRIQVSTLRPLYVAGETFETTISAKDAEGKPIAEKLTLKVLQQTKVNGKVGERLIEEHALATAATDGLARKTLKLDKGGNYTVRVEGIDRFKNPVSGNCYLQVSDDTDAVRLRIPLDTHNYKVGDTATIPIHWREAPALALVTFEGARVLDHRLVELKTGVNQLTVPITAKLAPNFDLAVAVMKDRREAPRAKGDVDEANARPLVRFYQASSTLNVERDLRVRIVAQRKGGGQGPVRPGDEIEVVVTTTDPQGKPVSAETSLAMVEQSLLDRFPWTVLSIEQFFRGQRRTSAMRTNSSITFAYAPNTQPINVRLLAEQDRVAVTDDEEASRKAMLDRLAKEQAAKQAFVRQDAAGDPFAPDAGDKREVKTPPPSTVPYVISVIPVADLPDPQQFAFSLGGFGRGGGGGNANSGQSVATIADPAAIAETAYWNPSIITDHTGKATATFIVPERSTGWKLLAKGITADTLAGEATQSLVVKKDLFGELKLPRSFTVGDRAQVLASVCNDVVDKGPVEVTLRTAIGGRAVEEKKTVAFDAKGIREVAFDVALNEATGDSVDFELIVAAGTRRDVSRRTVPLRPDGVSVVAAMAGSATADTTVWVESPSGMTLQQPRLSILLSPTVEQSLFDALLAPPSAGQFEQDRIASDVETATSDLLAGLGLQKLLRATRDVAGAQAESLDARIRAAIGTLVSSQEDNGGWSWTGSGNASVDSYATARALWALCLARKAGYVVPDANFDKATGVVENAVVAAADGNYETKAMLLHALSTLGKGDFTLANRLYRERTRLSAGALSHLALAMVEMDRKPIAQELLDALAKSDIDGVAPRSAASPCTLPWNQSAVELRALWALALQRVSPQSPKAKELVDWLLAHRVGHRWSPDKATGPAALALCQWFAESRVQNERYTLAMSVNDVQVKSIDVDPATGTQTIDVPTAMLKTEGKQRVGFRLTGRGRYAYQCILAGFVPADKVASTTEAWKIKRTFEPGPLEVEGREIARGFDVVQGNRVEFKNALTELPVARRAIVTLDLQRQRVGEDTPNEQLEYLVVTEPIPSGATVVENSVRGGFERFEMAPGAITFYVGNRRRADAIRYELSGYLPGNYRAGPTLLRNAHRPEQMAVAAPKSLAVLPLGARSSDPYRLTPRELLELGKHCFAKGDLKAAGEHLSELVLKWNLAPATYKEAVTTLLDIHLELGPAAQVVHYFEIVKEKWPSQAIPFDKIVKVGAAYHEMGEYERSYLIFRATIESSFLREAAVAGFLEGRGHFFRGVDTLARLLRDYPPEGYAAAAAYSLAQHVNAKAPVAADDPELRRQKINKVDLARRAWEMLESFLTAYPDDPAADRAAFAAATTLLELKSYKEAAVACNRYANRYPQSELLDAFWYVIGYCRFAGGEHQAAMELCRKVAESKRVDPATGREQESPNKWQAVYILGQIHHSLGQVPQAIDEYRRVEDKFADARQSIQYFLRKAIELPEAITVKPGTPAEVELKYRNIAVCDVKVYRIDLMKFSLLKRNLSGITNINLSGIRPYHEAQVALGDGKDYRDRTRKLNLPLKEEGAYLVVCRGDDLHASGLALVSPLAVDVEQDAVSGRVRATVKDQTSDKCVHDVQIKAIGSRNEDFISGQSDLRGVFVADGIVGAATVIAQAGPSRYAFYRAKNATVEEAVARLRMPQRSGGQAVASSTMDLRAPAASVEKIRQALESPTQLEFVDTPLTDVVDYLKDYHGIEVQIDKKALGDVGIDTASPITKNVKGVSLKAGLRMMLSELDLTYVIHDEVLLITTPEIADSHLETKIYPVADLVLPSGAPADAQADFDSLINLITSTVGPTTWDDVGGPGSVAPFENGLSIVVSQTQAVHEQTEAVIETLRKVVRENGRSDLPKPTGERRKEKYSSIQGFGGGMGGMGGMGGGTFGGPVAKPAAGKPNAAAAAPRDPDLLQGVQDMNKRLQGKGSEKLQEMYKGSSSGVGAGSAF